jgi:hypothetical protein
MISLMLLRTTGSEAPQNDKLIFSSSRQVRPLTLA